MCCDVQYMCVFVCVNSENRKNETTTATLTAIQMQIMFVTEKKKHQLKKRNDSNAV